MKPRNPDVEELERYNNGGKRRPPPPTPLPPGIHDADEYKQVFLWRYVLFIVVIPLLLTALSLFCKCREEKLPKVEQDPSCPCGQERENIPCCP